MSHFKPNAMMHSQVPNISSMPNKWLQVFNYVFLVVPSLDFMLEVKSSQKLTVPSVPFIENVDISWKNRCFSHFSVIFIGCCMVKCVQLAFDLIWPPAWSPDLIPPEKRSKTLEVIYWAYWRYSGPVTSRMWSSHVDDIKGTFLPSPAVTDPQPIK